MAQHHKSRFQITRKERSGVGESETKFDFLELCENFYFKFYFYMCNMHWHILWMTEKINCETVQSRMGWFSAKEVFQR